MNRTASEVAKSLRKKLIRLAHDKPELRAKLKPQILALANPSRVASFGKVAIKPETEDFIEWALNTQSPMSPNEIEAFVNRQLGIKTSQPVKKRPGPRFQRGDQVEIKKDKHKLSRFGTSYFCLICCSNFVIDGAAKSFKHRLSNRRCPGPPSRVTSQLSEGPTSLPLAQETSAGASSGMCSA